MAYYNPYYDFTKSGSDFLKDSGANTQSGGNITKPVGNTANPYQQQQPARDWTGALIGGLGQVGSALQQPNNPDDFSVDGMAGYSGSAQGFASGGAVGAIIGGVTAQFGTFNKVHQNLNKLDTGVNVSAIDPITGRPVYQGSGAVGAKQTMGALNQGQKAINKSYDPATHVISKVFGTGRKLRRKRSELEQNLRSGQQQFNAQTEQFNAQQAATTQYNGLLNNQNRLKNLYSIGTNLY
jgi:hypothetical protein